MRYSWYINICNKALKPAQITWQIYYLLYYIIHEVESDEKIPLLLPPPPIQGYYHSVQLSGQQKVPYHLHRPVKVSVVQTNLTSLFPLGSINLEAIMNSENHLVFALSIYDFDISHTQGFTSVEKNQ